jgi:hypothetical protein
LSVSCADPNIAAQFAVPISAEIEGLEIGADLLEQGSRYALPANTSALANFTTATMARFEASGGTYLFDEGLSSFGAYQPSTNTIFLGPGADASTMAEELYHFQQTERGLNQVWTQGLKTEKSLEPYESFMFGHHIQPRDAAFLSQSLWRYLGTKS